MGLNESVVYARCAAKPTVVCVFLMVYLVSDEPN